MNSIIAEMTSDIIRRAGDARRFLIAIAGPPGSGKSTLADELRASLKARGERAEVLPMDGFHMDDSVLIDRGLLARKGAPETFDVRAFLDIIRAVRPADQEVLVPVFDRSRELAIASARVVLPEHRFIIVEGNYLLLDQGKWAELEGMFDYSVMLAPPVPVLEKRLLERWLGYGLAEDVARAKAHGNDLPNGRLVLECRRHANVTIDNA
ncbi:ArgK protein [Rhizobium subbaraonis]|uniref:ArgK protein n=1 Tax=Rhizobium subbaraonis TaxID=908946 RepID=A0A285UHD0_9HYPH|nr:nucleoside triphosphate hydrolase [Rhizobium subbaraonis]SOC41315.1 ArgK protein [Rhizobium subbaraonis]